MPRRRQEGEDEEDEKDEEDRGCREGWTRHVPAEPVAPAPPGHPELTSPRGAPSGAAGPALQPGHSTSGKRSNPPGRSPAGPGAGSPEPRSPKAAGSTTACRPEDAPPTPSGLANRPRAPEAPGRGLLLRRAPLPGSLLSASRGHWARGAGSGPTEQAPFRPTSLPGPRCAARRRRSGTASPPPARPLRPRPRAPGLALGGPRSSLCPAHANPRPHSPRPLGASQARRRPAPQAPESSPAGGQSLGTKASGDLGKERKREQRGAAAVRVREHSHSHRVRLSAQEDAGSPPDKARPGE